jgi:hypothetical protein
MKMTETKDNSQPTVSIDSLDPIIQNLLNQVVVTDQIEADFPQLDAEKVAKDASQFVHKGVFMNLCSSIDYAVTQGQRNIATAEDQLKAAIQADAGDNRSDRTQKRLEGRIDWLAHQLAQQTFRQHLKVVFNELYHKATGEIFVPSRGNTVEKISSDRLNTADQQSAAAYLARQAAS